MPKKSGVRDLYALMREYGGQAQKTSNSQPNSEPKAAPAVPEEISHKPKLAFGVQSELDEECPACGGTGWVREDVPMSHPNFGKLFPCEKCRGTAQMERLQRLSRLNPALQKVRLDAFKPRKQLGRVVTNIKAWMRAEPCWLTLTGPPGTGKTFLMAAIANEYISVGTSALYTTVADLLADLQQTFSPKSDLVYSTLFANVMDVDVLLLDEAEKFQGTEWAQVQVFRLLEHRSRGRAERMRTVLATNRDLRPLMAGGYAELYPGGLFGGYIESRISGGMIIPDFWLESDFRLAEGTVVRGGQQVDAKQEGLW